MKKVILSIAMAIGMMAVALAQAPAVMGPSIQIDSDTYDFGTIDFKGEGTCTFTVTNTGTEPLIISKCKESCGCTTPKCDNNPIMPGETSAVKVKYDTSRVGPFNKSVTVTSNAVNEPVKVIHIKGTVKADASSGETAPAKPVVLPSNG